MFRVRYYHQLDSTNTYAKRLHAAGNRNPAVILAERQTAGHGRLSRPFYSPGKTGLYMSLYYPCTSLVKDAVSITAATAVAVSQAIEATSNRTACIKWVNDIYLDEKKACGILVEGSLPANGSDTGYIVIGIGINVCMPDAGFPPDIADKATSVFPDSRDAQRRKISLAAEIINRLTEYLLHPEERAFAEEYLARSFLPGRTVQVVSVSGQATDALVVSVEPDFRLRVRYDDGTEELLRSGEVSLRFLKDGRTRA